MYKRKDLAINCQLSSKIEGFNEKRLFQPAFIVSINSDLINKAFI